MFGSEGGYPSIELRGWVSDFEGSEDSGLGVNSCVWWW